MFHDSSFSQAQESNQTKHYDMLTMHQQASSSQLISLYRSFLRELPPLRLSSRALPGAPQSAKSSSPPRPAPKPPSIQRGPLHHQLRALIASTSTQSSAARNAPAPDMEKLPSIRQASQLLEYLKAQRVYVELLERYNPGLTLEDQDRIRLTARRVGLNLPIGTVKEKS